MTGSEETFDRLLGVVFDDVGPEQATASLELGERHRQPLGMVHGGVLAALMASAAREGARAWLAEADAEAFTESTTTDFLRPPRGDRLVAVATPLARAPERQTWQVSMRDSDGRLVAHGEVVLTTVRAAQGGGAVDAN